MTFTYRAYDLNIRSNIELPQLNPVSAEVIDLTIRSGPVSSAGLDKALVLKPLSQLNNDSLWFRVPGIAKFLVENGDRISFEAEAGTSLDDIRVYLLGTCLAAILYQKQRLVLRGAVVAKDEQSCFLLSGLGPVGKSAVAAYLHQQGYSLLADEFCVIDSRVMVSPGFPRLKLWRDTLDRLEIGVDSLTPIRSAVKKYWLPVDSGFCDTPRKVSTVYILRLHNSDEFLFEEIRGVPKLQTLKQLGYQPSFLDTLMSSKSYLQQLMRLASNVRVVNIVWPDFYFRVEELVARIEGHAGQGEQNV